MDAKLARELDAYITRGDDSLGRSEERDSTMTQELRFIRLASEVVHLNRELPHAYGLAKDYADCVNWDAVSQIEGLAELYAQVDAGHDAQPAHFARVTFSEPEFVENVWLDTVQTNWADSYWLRGALTTATNQLISKDLDRLSKATNPQDEWSYYVNVAEFYVRKDEIKRDKELAAELAASAKAAEEATEAANRAAELVDANAASE